MKLFNLLTEDAKKLTRNFFSLSIVQATNYLLPLITFPYLVRVLGPEKFGLIAFAQAFIQYFVVLTDYGFNLSATRSISIFRNDSEKINTIFSTVSTIKLLLGIFCFVIMMAVILMFQKFNNDWLLYVFSFGSVIGSILSPIWLFQGMERMQYIAILNMVAKIFFTFAIFIFIRKPSDYIYVPFINSCGVIISGLMAVYFSFKQCGISFKLPSFQDIMLHLKEGWYIFTSTAAINLYTVSNTFVLGLLTNNIIVGYFAAGEKIIKAARDCLGPFAQTMYPHINSLMSISRDAALQFIRKAAVFMGIIGLTLSVCIFAFARDIISILLGDGFIESLVVVRILAFLPALVGVNNVLGIQTMLTFNYKKPFFNILLSAGILNIVLALLLIPPYQYAGLSVAVLLSEVFVTVTMFAYLQLKGIKIFNYHNVLFLKK